MKSILWCAAAGISLALLAGCGDFFNQAGAGRKPVSPPGILPVDQMGDPAGPPVQPAPTITDASGATPPIVPPDPIEAKKQSLIAKTTNVVVDKKKAMAENASLVEIDGSAQGGDPVSFAASAYISMRARPGILNFQNQLQLFKAENDRNATYAEMTGMMKQHNIDFALLPAYQMYGYDAEKGTISILEDKADKARRYQEAGVPLE